MLFARAVPILGVCLGLIGLATSTDLISLRAVAYAASIPFVSAAVIGAREAMPTSVAHLLEPLCVLVGLALCLAVAPRPRRSLSALALGVLRLG